MNVKISQSPASQPHTETPAPEPQASPSDTKEIIYLASGLLVLVLGIGGLLMYSEETPLPATASQGMDKTQIASAFNSSDQQPASDEPLALSQALAEVPVTNSVIPITGTVVSQPMEETNVYFAFNEWTLSDEAKDRLKTRMENRPEGWTGTLRIVGHTDAQGPDAYNRALGLKRAQSVKTFLMSLGVAEGDLQVDTLGKDGSICQEETPECFEQNRRAHVALLPASPSEGEDLQLSMTPADTDSPAGEELALTTDESPIVPSDTELSVQEDVQEESVSSDPLLTVESLP
ncbi:MAG: OmpA family protein [Nitrospiraceae bacterium]|nr:OmpA family protein [Nitrospira sp.]MCB9775923.1 OmpA family protein [Nitrospiraceae bacterium]